MSLDVSLTISVDTGGPEKTDIELFSANITHNLGAMAAAAGIYEVCWRPETIGAQIAADIIPILEQGLALMKASPEHFKKFNAPNCWGTYNQFVPWVEEYLEACKKHPKAVIGISR
uniref:Uncharacterized protein n=1 Tax=viral metagenome TaxID=1070528 RepID=A0A6M3IPT1_9ZZZZ